MKKVRVYVAGKISPNSVFGTSHWRDGFCEELSKKSDRVIVNLDPTKVGDSFILDQSNPDLIYGRNCFLISHADLVIVNLTDDISVGGSQEMLIAKYFRKPLIGIAPKGGKFNKLEKEVFGVLYQNYLEPFVAAVCDKVVENLAEVASFIREELPKISPKKIKKITLIDESVKYYRDNFFSRDKEVCKRLKDK